MSQYNVVDPGSKVWRSRKQIGGNHNTTIDFGKVYPMLAKFVLPGDTLKIGARIFARYQATLAPILNSCMIRARYFYVNHRQVVENIADIITGTHDGKELVEPAECKNFVADVTDDANYVVTKGSFWDYLGIPCLDYKAIKNDECLPAQYWYKAYMKIFWDYFRDENLFEETDFEQWWTNTLCKLGGKSELFSANLGKDYITSATPYEMKGEVPTFDVEVSEPFRVKGIYGDDSIAPLGYYTGYEGSTPGKFGGRSAAVFKYDSTNENYESMYGSSSQPSPTPFTGDHPINSFKIPKGDSVPNEVDYFQALAGISGKDLNGLWNGFSGSFNMRDIRRMGQLTRIKEREMRCGSRYTEYLRSNFHTAPADETLQRPIYLGGFKQPIVTNEVLQQAEDGNTPVGTMRGKGITDGGNNIGVFHAKEFGMLFCLVDVVPETIYTQGINRELTYKKRYDFFNPSFQNLSEQEVRNGEVYISTTDGKNDDTFGFQGMYNELRSKRNMVTSELRDNLKYWTQAIEFASRPNLNYSMIKADSYLNSYKRPFAVLSGANPIILHMENYVDAYRPMISNPVPGLVDHN